MYSIGLLNKCLSNSHHIVLQWLFNNIHVLSLKCTLFHVQMFREVRQGWNYEFLWHNHRKCKTCLLVSKPVSFLITFFCMSFKKNLPGLSTVAWHSLFDFRSFTLFRFTAVFVWYLFQVLVDVGRGMFSFYCCSALIVIFTRLISLFKA